MSTRVDMLIDQGASFQTTIDLVNQDGSPLDVTSMTAAAQLRHHYTATNATSFSTALTTGELVLTLSANQTGNLVPGRYVYDVLLADAGNTYSRLLEGVATVTPSVTK